MPCSAESMFYRPLVSLSFQCLLITVMIIRVTQMMAVIVIAVFMVCPFLIVILVCEVHDGFSLGYFHVGLCPMHFVPRGFNVAIEFAVL